MMRRYTQRDHAICTLGGKCENCEMSDYAYLEIDHIDGRNNGEETSARAVLNVLKGSQRYQLLCVKCHKVKTKMNRDYERTHVLAEPDNQMGLGDLPADAFDIEHIGNGYFTYMARDPDGTLGHWTHIPTIERGVKHLEHPGTIARRRCEALASRIRPELRAAPSREGQPSS